MIKTHCRSRRRREALPWLATAGRVPLLMGLLASISIYRGSTWIWIVAIVAADVADGMFARRLDADTRGRRIADSILDRLSIHSAFGIAVTYHPSLLWLYVPLAIRDGFAMLASGWLVANGLLLLGGRWHKLASLSCAVFGVTLVSGGHGTTVVVGLATVAINYVLLLDYVGGYVLYRRLSRSTRRDRYRITELAGLRYVCTFASNDRVEALDAIQPASA